MRRPDWSLTVSLLVHAGILISAVVALPQAKLPPVEERDPISVEIVEITDTSTRVATKPDAPKVPEAPPAPPKAEPAPKPKKQAAVEPEPEPEPVPTEPAPPDEKKLEELVKKAEEAPAPKPEPPKPAPPKPRPKPKPKPKAPEKPKLNVDELAALLNKIPDEPPPVEESQTDGVPSLGDIEQLLGRDAANSADLVDYLSQATSRCWSPPTGVAEAQDLVISVKIAFGQDGSVTGTPQVMNSSANPLFNVAAAAAVRAVLICAPYEKLPRDRYEEWRETQINFNPANMFAP
ncbi:MAG: hypothetical protein NWR47_04795 [Aestuariivirgaceae bacterium]|nr:hypothetical protein [Aestuariivirgaceae bacterium]